MPREANWKSQKLFSLCKNCGKHGDIPIEPEIGFALDKILAVKVGKQGEEAEMVGFQGIRLADRKMRNGGLGHKLG